VVECAGCYGEGCGECQGTGRILVTTCPLDFAGDDVWDALEMTSYLEHGALPIPGGVLDQTHIFLEAARFIGAERARQRAAMWERS